MKRPILNDICHICQGITLTSLQKVISVTELHVYFKIYISLEALAAS